MALKEDGLPKALSYTLLLLAVTFAVFSVGYGMAANSLTSSPIVNIKPSGFGPKFLNLTYSIKLVPRNPYGKSCIVVFNPYKGGSGKGCCIVFSKGSAIFANVSIDYSESLLRFQIVFRGGVLVSSINENNPCHIDEKAIIRRNVTYVISSVYNISNEDMQLYTLNGKWAGAFPYLAKVSPNKPVVKLFYLRPVITGCVLSKKDLDAIELLGKLMRLRNLRNLLGVTELKPGESISVKTQSGVIITYKSSPSGVAEIVVKKCCDFSSIIGVINPLDHPSAPYRFGVLVFDKEELVKASINLELNKTVGGLFGKGIAWVIKPTQAGYLAMIAINTSILPTSANFSSGVVLLLQRLSSLYSFLSGLNAVYHIKGFLVHATIIASSTCEALLPTLDLSLKYCLMTNAMHARNSTHIEVYNAKGIQINLINVKGVIQPPIIRFSKIENDYTLLSIPVITILLGMIPFVAKKVKRIET